jgi:ferredoxin
VRITVDTSSCIGSGQCALAVPEVFDQEESHGGVVLLDGVPPADLHGAVHEAADRCPVRAITVTDN